MKSRPVTCKEVRKALLALGFEEKKSNHGAHEKYEHPFFQGKRRVVTISAHHAPFHRKLMAYMSKQAGLKPKIFWEVCVGERCPTTLIGQRA